MGSRTFSMNSTNSLATTTLEVITTEPGVQEAERADYQVNNSLVAFLIETIEHDVETISPMTHGMRG
jgi:hypothetical protein